MYGPDSNSMAIVFIDDLNIVKKENFGAQPPLELIRQLMDKKFYYDPKSFEKRRIEGLFYITAMGLPGGGRSEISERVVRNWNLIGYTHISGGVIFKIFTNIMDELMTTYPAFVTDNVSKIVEVTINSYNNISRSFMPVPMKPH